MKSSSRRDFLRVGAVLSGAGVLGGGAALAAPDAEAAGRARPGRGRFDADVIVVGAGFSGMTAAYRVRRAGYSAIVVDALDRVGGRSWSTTLSNGTFFDIGAGWVSTRSVEIQALIKEFGLQTYFTVGRLPSDGQSLFVGLDGTVTPYSGIPPISEEALLELASPWRRSIRSARRSRWKRPGRRRRRRNSTPPRRGSSSRSSRATPRRWAS